MYTKLKYIGASFWALTYICFIYLAINHEYAMIPLAVCTYNIAYELLYTVLADSKGQRIRNGVWFCLDIIIIYYHLNDGKMMAFFCTWFTVMLIVQIITTMRISKTATKAFAWPVTALMGLLLMMYPATLQTHFVGLALAFKLLGDGFYGIAHLSFGLPKEEKLNKNYLLFVKLMIVTAFTLNLINLLNYLTIS